MKRRHLTMAALSAAVLLAVSACGSGGDDFSDSASGPAQLTIAVYPKSSLALPWVVAQEQGFFKNENLEVNIITADTGQQLGAVLLSGDVSISSNSPGNTLPLVEQGADVKITGPVLAITQALIARSDKIHGTPTTYPDSAKLVKGLTIGVNALGGISDLMLRSLLKNAGLDPDKDVAIIATGSTATTVTALTNGRVDAVFAGTSTNALIKGQANITEIINTASPELADVRSTVSHMGDSTTGRFVTKRPQVFARYCNAMDSAIKWSADPANKERYIAITEKETGLDAAGAELVWKDEATAWSMEVSQKRFQGDIDLYLGGKAGKLKYDSAVVACK